MVKSMTGYGRAVETVNGREFTVEVRSVNNRYLDCTVKLPRGLSFGEDAVKQATELPRLLFGCGEDDMLYKDFLAFREKADRLGLKADYFSIPGLKHEWRFWDQGIQKALDFFDGGRGDPGGFYRSAPRRGL